MERASWGMYTHDDLYTDSVKCVAFTNDNLRVLAGAHCAKDQLKAWNTGTGTCLNSYIGHTHAIMCMLLTSGDQTRSRGLVMAPLKCGNKPQVVY